MASNFDLYPEDQDELWPLIDAILARLDGAGGPNTTQAAIEAVRQLEQLEALGCKWASRPLQQCLIEGMRRLIAERLKADRGSVRIAHTGAVISLPTRMGIKTRGSNGVASRQFQQPLWWELSWPQFEEMVQSFQRQRDKLSSELAALLEIQRLRELYPESKTPGDACIQGGIDPRQFAAVH